MLKYYLNRSGQIPTAAHPFVKPESFHQLKPLDTLKKADFALTPYIKSSNLRATYQVLNTVVPYVLLWIAAVKITSISWWFLPPIIVLLVLFSLRCFSLMHDCGHNSLFRSKRANRIMGFLLGVINAIPQYGWSRDHAYHHKTNGDWERYRGVADFLSTEEFSQLDPFNQRLYELLRHPLMAIPGGFFYLVIKPRVILLAGVYDFIHHIFSDWKNSSEFNLAQTISTHSSKHWQSAAEFWDLLLNNICVVGSWIFLSHLWGVGLFWGIYSITLSCSATIFIWVFFVQHIFEDAYAHKTSGWNYVLGAVKGSSYLELPIVLRWFTADIGYHNIHHLCERIPNYHLAACHHKNSHLLSEVKTLRIGDLLNCSQFLLWDADSDRLVSISSFRQAARTIANPASNSAIGAIAESLEDKHMKD
ncbi:fatty acid desaturase [Kamptonema cortianum]|uniref:Fatty acid desaturase n=1 Tax=Geitlerinema calcuttense NRMC-F 0142 TaxID=2922238 RepID=A0ABT7LXV2_9CYAN|nr:fatty acid desaturase [Geitlerinema calcuttense]MDK3159268.1 fatty acid desaturase [Kamptonema cortianum]MDL5056846.1 fatty acid desaturase [Geitlerinema calcuttense NRMC-F 0142]